MTSTEPGLVVVGASLAGLRAVEAARDAGYRGPITLIGAERHLPYDRPPLSKSLLTAAPRAAHPPYRPESELVDELGVRLLLGAPATGLDPDARLVTVGDRAVPYSSLVIATGARARALPVAEGVGGVHLLRTVDDAEGLRDALDGGGPVVVLGAGFIGSEVAASARSQGLEVTIVELADTPLVRALGRDTGEVLARLHRANSTALRLGTGITGVESQGGALTGVVLSDGSRIETATLVVGAGAAPATDWLVGSGILLDERDGGVLADETLATSLPGVWAAGDVVHWPNAVLGRRMRLEHWTSAAEQGAVAGRNAVASAPQETYETVPYFWSDWYGHRIQFVGTSTTDEPPTLIADLERDGRHLALYREGDRIVGAFTIDLPTRIMKYRRLIAAGARWSEALDLAAAS